MSTSSSRKVIVVALLGNLLISLTKFVAAAITGSSAMLSEGIHSVVDTGNQILLLYGMKRAQRPADEEFPFGHGKEVYFWSFVVAILIFAVGAGVSIYEGIHHILQPAELQNPLVNYIVLGLAIVFEGAAWLFALKAFRKSKGQMGYIEAVQRGKDPSMFVVVFEDSAAILGLIIALAGISLAQWTGNMVFDGIASVIIGMILGFTAVWLAYETKGLLIGESANRRVRRGIRAIALQYDNIEAVNELLTMHMGPDFILVNISLKFRPQASASEIESTIARMESTISNTFPEVKRIFSEAESHYIKPEVL